MSGQPEQPQQLEEQQRGGFRIQAYNNISNLRSVGANISIARESVSFGDGVSQENIQKVLDILNQRNDEGSSITAYGNVENMDMCETTVTLTDKMINLPAQPDSNGTSAIQTSDLGGEGGLGGGARAEDREEMAPQ